MSGAAHRDPLRALGFSGAELGRLERYLDLLAAWAARTNLTGARTPEERVRVLVAPVLAGLEWIRPGHLLDVGSGNGSPGLVLALLREDLRATLLEPRQRRWAFLREAARAAGREGLDIRRERLEAYAGPSADTLTARAVALEAERVAGRLAPGGRAVIWGLPLRGGSEALVERFRDTEVVVYDQVSRGMPATT